jgi:cell division protein FtsW
LGFGLLQFKHQLSLTHVFRRKLRTNKEIDRKLLFLTVILVFLGLIAVADASAPQGMNFFSDKYFFVKQQAMWGTVGLVVLLIVSRINYNLWNKLALPFFLVGVCALILVLIPGIGIKVLGARRWISLGSQSFQPSELIKLLLVIYLAKVGASKKGIMAFLVPLVIVTFLVMLEPDLGTTLIIALIGMSIIFISGVNFLLFLVISISGILLSLAVSLLSDYRRSRLLTFFKATTDPLGRDYHIRQVLLALGSGGLFGVGLGQSRQKYLFLPEAATDSIFAVIAEEIGFIGALIIILLFAVFVFECFRIAKNAPDKFSHILAVGITAWIGGQTLINIASMVAMVPLTGIPLPFFSYGGSTLITILFGVGILLNISKNAKAN